ncbi:helix-turn-helix domain-containing protein [Microcoleus sp. Pol11C3]
MQTTYQYKLYPDTNQKLRLNEWRRICRYWYMPNSISKY